MDVLRVLEMKDLDLQASQGSAVSEVTGSLGRRRDQGEQDLSSTFFRLPTGGNHAGSPKREMVRVRRATAGTKLAIVVMSALLLRLRLLEGESDPGNLSEGYTKRGAAGACVDGLGTGVAHADPSLTPVEFRES